jgi:hypothetical protein
MARLVPPCGKLALQSLADFQEFCEGMRGFFSAASPLAPAALAPATEPRTAPAAAKTLPADSLVASLFAQHASVPSLQVLCLPPTLLHLLFSLLTTLRPHSGL